MSDNTLTGWWRLEQVGQHSSDEFIFLNEVQKVSRYRGVRRVPSLRLSQYGSAELLSEYQKTVPTCLGRLRATHCCSLQSEPGCTHLENHLLLTLNKKLAA